MSWLLLFLIHNLAISIFRAIGAIARNLVVANACGSLMLMLILMQGGFVLPRAAEGGLRDTQQAVAGLVEGVVQTNLRVTQELFRLSNPAAMVELQQRFVREYLDTLMSGTATLVRAVRRTADETLRPLEEQVQQRQTQNGQQGYQQAAE